MDNNNDTTESQSGDELSSTMSANVTILVDGEEPHEQENGHLSRKEGSFRRNSVAPNRRSRSSPATETEEGANAVVQRVQELTLRSVENILNLFKKGSRRSHGPKEHEPGLRSMLYGLDAKLEKEEAQLKKRQKKMHLAPHRNAFPCVST